MKKLSMLFIECDPLTYHIISLLNLNGHSVSICSTDSTLVVKDQLTHVSRGCGTHDLMSGIRRKGNAIPGTSGRIGPSSHLAVEFQDRTGCDSNRACRGTNDTTIADHRERSLYLKINRARILAAATDRYTLNRTRGTDYGWAAHSGRARASLTIRRTGCSISNWCEITTSGWITGISSAGVQVIANRRCVDTCACCRITGIGGTGIAIVAVDRCMDTACCRVA